MMSFSAAGLTVAQAWFAVASHLSQMATGALVTAIWQGILLAAAAALGLRLVPKIPAAVRFAIWFAVFLVVAALPAMSLWPHAGSAAQTDGKGAWLILNEHWCLAIAAVWGIASLVRAATLVGAALRVRALWLRARAVELFGDVAEGTAGSFDKLRTGSSTAPLRGFAQDDKIWGAADTGRRKAQICVSDEIDRPTVIGFFSPKILIPAWLLEKLTPAELEQIVVHEIGHLGRADDWMNLLQKIALVVFPLNPALAWVERRLCFERELAVDEQVLRAFAGRAGAATAYAACLATLAEYRLGRRALALALGALGRESELGRRVGRILRRGESMKPLHSKLVLGGAMLGLLLGAAGLERCPQVVAFANPKPETVAQSSATNGLRETYAGFRRTAVIQVAVVHKANIQRMIQPGVNVPHETLLMAQQSTAPTGQEQARTAQEGIEPTRNGPGGARMVQAEARIPGAARQPRSVSDVEPAQPAPVLTQWMVVTTWNGNTVSRMVLTASAPDGSQTPISTPSADGATQPTDETQQVHRYAVPVQGGWLVIQL